MPEAPPPEKAQETDKVDLLEVYRGLVASGRLTWDDEQVRVVMKVSHFPCTVNNSFDTSSRNCVTTSRRYTFLPSLARRHHYLARRHRRQSTERARGGRPRRIRAIWR